MDTSRVARSWRSRLTGTMPSWEPKMGLRNRSLEIFLLQKMRNERENLPSRSVSDIVNVMKSR